MLRENWTSASPGYTGTSYNFYNRRTDIWTQVWVDNQGGSLHLTGGLQDGNMVLSSSTVKNPQGQDVVHRITWTPNADGTVRQLWQMQVEGADWVVAFDGLYRRVN